MDEHGQAQPPAIRALEFPYNANADPYQANQTMNTSTSILGGRISAPSPHVQLLEHQLWQQQQLQQHLQTFWANQRQEIMTTIDFKNHCLPLSRIKKIMKADRDVRMIAAEAPVLFARACELFIMELTHRSWVLAEESKRRTLLKDDIKGAVTRLDILDFLMDIMPGDEAMIGGPKSDESPPYHYAPPEGGYLGMLMGETEVDQGFLYTQQQPWEQASQAFSLQTSGLTRNC